MTPAAFTAAWIIKNQQQLAYLVDQQSGTGHLDERKGVKEDFAALGTIDLDTHLTG